jgi:hypothetical protein
LNKVLVLAVTLLAFSVLATPVLAIGPNNAEGNLNIYYEPYGVGLELPNERHQEWVTSNNKHLTFVDARDFTIRTAVVINAMSEVAGLENKWVYFSAVKWGDWLCFVLNVQPSPPPSQWAALHMYALTNYPDGVYYREVLVGN